MTTRRLFFGLMVTGILATATGGFTAPARLASQPLQGIEGSWLVSNPARPGVVSGAITFAADGSAIVSAINPLVTSAHGQWVKAGDRQFQATLVHLRRNAEGGFEGMIKHRTTITLNESADAYTARWGVDVYGPDGSLLDSRVEDREGARIRLEPLD